MPQISSKDQWVLQFLITAKVRMDGNDRLTLEWNHMTKTHCFVHAFIHHKISIDSKTLCSASTLKHQHSSSHDLRLQCPAKTSKMTKKLEGAYKHVPICLKKTANCGLNKQGFKFTEHLQYQKQILETAPLYK